MACNNKCTTKGMAVLPVRYAVVPEYFDYQLPGWANDSGVTGIALTNGEKYALRALRQGYFYVFYANGAQGNNYWQCYSVAEDGSLWLQTVASNPAAVKEPDCQSGSHVALNVEFMCIESPDKCGDVWFAFSQYPWNEETLNNYKNDSSARDSRMQKISPQAWINNQKSKSGTVASEESLADVLDYKAASVAGLLPGPDEQKVSTLSSAPTLRSNDTNQSAQPPGWQVTDAVLKSQSSLYPWARSRSGGAKATVTRMQARSECSAPLLLPIWDAVGITHELNGWCQDVLGRQAQFIRERETEMGTMTNLDALKTMLSSMTENRGEVVDQRFAQGGEVLLSPENLDGRMRILEQKYRDDPEVLEQLRQDNEVLKSWRGQNVPYSDIMDFMSVMPKPLSLHQKRIAEIKARVEQQIAMRPQNMEENIARDWAPYQGCLNQAKQDQFRACFASLCSDVEKLFHSRVKSLLKWLDAPQMQVTLDDFLSTDPDAGEYYQSIVTMAMNGINNSPEGAAKLDSWWNEYSVNNKSNLIWRHVAANNPEIMVELEPLLVQVKQKKDVPVTPLTAPAMVTMLMSEAAGLKKLTGFYAKSVTSVNKGLASNATALERSLHQTDAFMATVGDRAARILRVDKSGEFVATTAFRLLTKLRAGIPLEKAEALVNHYLREAPEMRRVVIESFRSSQRFMLPEADVMVRRQWMDDELRKYLESEEGKGEMRLARVNGLLLVLNAVDFIYLCGQFKDGKKPLSSLAASGLAMVSQTTTLIMPAIEKGLAAKDLTVSWIKGVGAAAGMVASGISVYADGIVVGTEFSNQRFFLTGIMVLKTGVDLLSVAKYTGTLLEIMGNQSAKRIASKITTTLTMEILGVRVLALLMLWEAQVAIILLQVVVAWLSDNDLQIWCKKCVFGIEPVKEPWDKQSKTLEDAFRAVL